MAGHAAPLRPSIRRAHPDTASRGVRHDRLPASIEGPAELIVLSLRYRDGNLRGDITTARGRVESAGRGSRQGQFNIASGSRHGDPAVAAHQAAAHAAATRMTPDFSVDVQETDVTARSIGVHVATDGFRMDSAARSPQLDVPLQVLRGDVTARSPQIRGADGIPQLYAATARVDADAVTTRHRDLDTLVGVP